MRGTGKDNSHNKLTPMETLLNAASKKFHIVSRKRFFNFARIRVCLS
jgi:hypothetical protein